MKQNSNVKMVCFSSYGSSKFGSLLATPFSFDYKTSKYGKFSEQELSDLFVNFSHRTQIHFIFESKVTPQNIKQLILQLTDGHVGYVSAILHELNKNHSRFEDNVESLLQFMYSNTFYNCINGKRPLTEFYKLDKEKQEALKEIWRKRKDTLNSNKYYEEFVRRGYISVDEDDHVQLFCPISKQLILMNMFNIVRPEIDKFNDLPSFLDAFLRVLGTETFQQTLSVGTKGEILESLWQEEFYRIGCSLLCKKTQVSVEVQYIEDVKLSGKVDFYVNGEKCWAIEFLICGNLSDTTLNFETRALEHLSRFDKGGKYFFLKPKDYLVIDFRPQSMYQKDLIDIKQGKCTNYHNYWIVNYDNKNWEELLITKMDKNGMCLSKEEKILFIK